MELQNSLADAIRELQDQSELNEGDEDTSPSQSRTSKLKHPALCSQHSYQEAPATIPAHQVAANTPVSLDSAFVSNTEFPNITGSDTWAMDPSHARSKDAQGFVTMDFSKLADFLTPAALSDMADPIGAISMPINGHSTPDQSLENRMTTVWDSIKAQGFDSFDEMITTFYTSSFAHSALSKEQRFSRNRRLPKLITDLAHAADRWCTWERHGFYEEILKAAETTLIAEDSKSSKESATVIDSLVDDSGQADQFDIDPALDEYRNLVRERRPNIWALITTLCQREKSAMHVDGGDRAIKAMLAMDLAGAVSSQRLLQLFDKCV